MEAWLGILLIPALVCWWVCLTMLFAWLGGWRALARRYRATRTPEGERFGMQAARFGWVDYNGCITIRVSADGIYFAIWPGLLFVGHPPLLIPWSALNVEKVRESWLLKHVVLSVDLPPVVRIRVPLRVVEAAQRIRAAENPLANGASSPQAIGETDDIRS